MNAVEFLKNQHREVEDLFSELEGTADKGATAQRKALYTEIAEKLKGHTAIEEKLLYPAGKDIDEETTLEAYEEHAVAKKLMQTIDRTKANDETFMAKISVLREIVRHHVQEEEEKYFPKLEKEMGPEGLDELGVELEAAFEKLQARPTAKKRIARSSRGRSSHAQTFKRAS